VWWIKPEILATWEAVIKRIVIPGQPQQKSFQDLISMEKTGHGDGLIIPAMAGSIK
jgi:hypothetical protein